MKIVGLASLYEPLEFLETKVANLNSCDLSETLIHWCDCSSEKTWKEVEKILTKSKFEQKVEHVGERETLYWTWNHIILESGWPHAGPEYFTNVNVDDIHAPEYFKILSRLMDQNPEIQVIAPAWHHMEKKPDGAVERIDVRHPKPGSTMGHFPMWRASVHQKVGIFDERMVAIGDSDFWNRVKHKFGVGAFAVHDVPLAIFLLHENNLYFTSRGPHGESGEGWDRSLTH